MKTIIILASGNGTNAEAIIRHLQGNETMQVGRVIASKPDAGVLARAKRLNIPGEYLSPSILKSGPELLKRLQEMKADYLVLAGYLLKVPDEVVEAYDGRIMNIHPALLPAYGGKGMYGDRVHEAVIKAGERQSGITIHNVDSHYDHGKILLQARCDVLEDDTVESLAQRIHHLEHRYFPIVVEQEVSQLP